MTVQDIFTIIGDSVDDLGMLAEADRRAAAFLEARKGVLMDEMGIHYNEFESIATAADGDRVTDAKVELEEFPRNATADDELSADASSVAADYYAPQLRAAYYFGLAIGMRLSGGAR